ncbi:MAG: hypothetical protein HZC54_13500 [Verrucomicrobia bacterium]|nr:hypothetical protein [Verrucomicrobiota bacterium]
MRMCGDWNGGSHQPGDVVFYQGMLYIAMQACDSATPDTDNRWRVLTITGPQGIPGEVTAQQLTDAIATTSANTNAVQLLDTSGITDPVQLMLANKINEMLNAQRR